MTELIVTLAILAGSIYWIANHHGSSSSDKVSRKRLENQGLVVPAHIDVNQPKQMEGLVLDQINQADATHQKALDCATDENAAGCKVPATATPQNQ